ncbi:MAG: IPT/TIG domain-containing protein [Candidatus Komeilibacteria bacterium]|nr:IPT/TIG domain-containing protein [Candidatus Komeilibacteria bacterium]
MKRSVLPGIILAAVFGIGLVAAVAHAQGVSIDFPTSFAGFSSQDIKVTIANIVRIILGFLGILFLLLILAGGFIWMTSQGEPDKINRAKKIIASAVIGLLITLSAYAISSFIVQSLQQAVSTGGGGPGGCVPPGCTPIPNCPPPAPGVVKVCSVTNPAFISQVAEIEGYNFGGVGPGSSVTVNGQNVAPVVCSGTSQWTNQRISVEISANVPLGTSPNNVIVTPNGAPACTGANCGTTDVKQGVGPYIRCMNPSSGPSDGSVTVTLDGKNFGAVPGAVAMEGALARFDVNNPPPLTNIGSWADDQIQFTVPAASNPEQAISGYVTVRDAGALVSNGKYFTVTCTVNSNTSVECASQCCSGLQCHAASVCQTATGGPGAPVITNIVPNDGAPGNLVTIQGKNFGVFGGSAQVTFVDSANTNFAIVGPPFASCTTWWGDTQIVIQVPPSAASGIARSVQVVTAASQLSNQWQTFNVNATQRPGLCSVAPAQGPPLSTLVTVQGLQFGAAAATRDLFFGAPPPTGFSAGSQSFNLAGSPQTGSGLVPNLTAGRTTVSLKVDSEYSNPLTFLVEAAGSGNPIIYSVTPSNGPDNTYSTISGSGFGTSPGAVWFIDSGGTQRPADIQFPAQCGPKYWADDHIVVKSPIGLPAGTHYLYVWNSSSNRYSQNASIPGVNQFVDDSTKLRPGICRIDPIGGPAGTTKVDYFGDNFGTANGTVWFDKLVSAPSFSSWDNKQAIDSLVPDSAVTGTTTVQSAVGRWGNTLPFFVGSCSNNSQCGVGNECCVSDGTCRPSGGCTGVLNTEDNPWSFVTDFDPFDLVNNLSCTTNIQAPTPYPYDQVGGYNQNDPNTNAPVNSMIVGRFTRDVDITVIQTNVRIYKCGQGATWPSGACADLTNPANFQKIGFGAWQYDPGTMDNATWYEVHLDNGGPASNIRAVDNSLYEGSAFLDPGLLGGTTPFRWHFRTRASGQPLCDVATLRLSPNTAAPPAGQGPLVAPVGGISAQATALPTSAQCYVCNGSAFDYSWSIANGVPPNASFEPPPIPPLTSPNINRTKFRGENVTASGPIDFTATLNNPPSGTPITSSPGKLSVEFVTPRVIDYGPAFCTAACKNSVPFADFNVDVIDPPSLAAIKLYECSDQFCTALTPVSLAAGYPQFSSGGPQGDHVDLLPQNLLKNSTWYRVIVGNSITNTQGLTMAAPNLNYDDPTNGSGVNDSFSWTFQTSNVQCQPVTVRVIPATATINSIGGTYPFSAVAEPATSCKGVRLNPFSYDWTWSIAPPPPGVADISHTPNPGPGAAESPVQRATAFQAGTATIQATIPNPSVTGVFTSVLTVNDFRDPINLIGHRPDLPPGKTPPEPSIGGCLLGGAPNQCSVGCTNVLASAVFSTYLNESSLRDTTPGGAIALYSFDDGTPRDTSGNNHDGVFQEDAKASSPNTTIPKLGRGAEFDGVDCTTPIPCGDAVVVDAQAALAPPNQITVAAWVFPRTWDVPVNGNSGIVSKRTNSWGGMWIDNTGKVWARVYQKGDDPSGPGQFIGRNAASQLQLNQWQHLALVADGTTLRLYVNGQQTSSVPYDGTLCSPQAGAHFRCTGADLLYIGQQWTSPDVLDGFIDEVRIYDRGLSAADVSALYLSPLGAGPSKFYVADVTNNTPVPGTISVTNYTDTSVGICTGNPAKNCTLVPCGPGEGTCSFKRGRIDFTPELALQPLPSGAVSVYTFDDGTAADTIGSNHGTIHGSVNASSANTQFPALGRAMSFGGNAGSYIDVGNDPSLGITSDVTVSAWIQPTDLSQSPAIARWGLDAPYGLRIRSGGEIEFVLHTGPASPGGAWVNPATTLPYVQANGQWQHVAVTRNGTTYRYYYNGTFVEQKVQAGVPSAPSAGSLFEIGSASNGTIQVFQGLIDDVRMYPKGLSAGEISRIFQNGQGVSYPAGVYDPNTDYAVRICQNSSCVSNPIRSAQGVAYTTPQTFGFHTGATICSISFVDITPNPAIFSDRLSECTVATTPQCASVAPKVITAHAKDAGGLELAGITYSWTETAPPGTYVTKYYDLVQNGSNAAATHKGVIGADTNEVSAEGNPAIIPGKVTAQGRMSFDFCVNPWYGQAVNPFYLDSTYDFKIRYCRDAKGSDPSNPATILPSLPAPHIERSSAGFGIGGDLLKEHVFIVDSTATGVGGIGNQPPNFISPTPVPGIQTSYRLGQLVSVKLDAKDPDGDSFLYTMDTASDPLDSLPASASFNQKTGSFIWVIDKMPTTDSPLDTDTTNDFEVTFTLNPSGAAAPNDKRTIVINVESGTPPPPVSRPVVSFTSPAAGSSITLNYGQTQSFEAQVTANGAGASSIKSFVWDFQDSGLSAYTDVIAPTYAANHVFLQAGLHQATFRVQNDLGVWSDPTVVNVNVRSKTTLRVPEDPGGETFAARFGRQLFAALIGRVNAQTLLSAPSQLAAVSAGQAPPTIELKWQNNGVYSGINIYRDGTALATGLPPGTVSYTDSPVVVGVSYVYRICGASGLQEQCAEITTVSRNVDYDVIVSRVYKNLNSLTVDEWYKTFAPNPTGSPKHIEIDGYDAIAEGTSVYLGVANCTRPADCQSGVNPADGIYTNVLLFSYNLGAKQSTIDIFNQIIDQLRINDTLVTRDDGGSSDRCSQDNTIICDPGHDAVCAARNAGLCTSAKAELRRDYKRIVDLHTILSSLDAYALQNHFCDDGTNSTACNTDADCPIGNRCVGAYPSLSSGSYVAGISTSRWPSWDATLGKELAQTPMPTDPINAFGANFYSPTPASCTDFPGYDKNTCWNERTSKFQCHDGSEVYLYQNVRGNNFKLYGLAEANKQVGGNPVWKWVTKDSRIVINDSKFNNLCTTNAPVNAICGNGLIEGAEVCDGGSTNYCDSRLGSGNWNNDFKVGCKPDCTGWGDPYGGDLAAAQAACGGSCGNGTIDPAEQCDPNAVPKWAGNPTCTAGGSIYCSNACQISCTAGSPYSGLCGDGIVQLPEVCDEGAAQNGQPGHCNTTCTGYGSYCGDGAVTPLDEYSLGCVDDSTINAASCNSGYAPLAGSTCSSGPGSYHQWSCVANVEECDNVVGLTTYSCPANTSLYCDGICQRACTTVDIDAANGTRKNVPVYEHYFEQGTEADYDYTLLPKADAPYTTKGITFYAYSATTNSLNTTDIYRFKSDTTADHLLSTQAAALPGYTLLGPAFEAYTQAKGGSINSTHIVPVYEFTSKATAIQGPADFTAQYTFDSGTAADTLNQHNGVIVGTVPSVLSSLPTMGKAMSFSGANSAPTVCQLGGTCALDPGTRCDNLFSPCAVGACNVVNDCSTPLEEAQCNQFPNPFGYAGCRSYNGFDYISVAAPFSIPKSVSLSAWFKGADVNLSNQYILILSSEDPVTPLEDWIGLSIGGKGLHGLTDIGGNWPSCDIVTGPLLADNTWYHVVFVIDDTNLSLYLNGTQRAATAIPGLPTCKNTGFTSKRSLIGDDGLPWFPGAFKGEIDDVRIYDYALTAADITSIYKQTLGIQLGSGEHYYSRNSTPRSTAQGASYIISNGGFPVFHAWEGPFQESCGNDVIEGNESCEPDVYQVPTAAQSSVNTQYQCGQPFTPNACRTYGGYCGDASKNSPFEQCDEGTGFSCALVAASCQSDNDCSRAACDTTAGVNTCVLSPAVSCTKDSDCPQNTCNGNGAVCNNNGGNCSYCSKSCSQAIVSRNYCGDGIINCGINTPGDCTDQDPYTEVCDDGVANNGKAGQCNVTCSGRTGSVCGNTLLELLCNNAPSNDCSTAALKAQCQNGADGTAGTSDDGVCGGEVCDDGVNNGTWSYQCPLLGKCSVTIGQSCTLDGDCPIGETCLNGTDCTLDSAGDQKCDLKDDNLDNNSIQCGGRAKAYCGFSCLGSTPAVCGDGVVQQPNDGQDRIPNTSDDRIELCDSGVKNGTAGFCNATCDNITAAVCGDGSVGAGTCVASKDSFGAPQRCQTDIDCSTAGDTCTGGETCDPPASTTTQSCTDNGLPGLQQVQCSNQCQALNSQCHAFGLKIWSDGVDVAYLNGSLMVLKPSGAPLCFGDPDLQGADYSQPTSPPTGNQCSNPSTQVPDQAYTVASDVRPIDSAGQPAAFTFERNGPNTVAVKVWAQPATANRSFLAVYSSPTARRVFPTVSGQSSSWACSNVYTPGWEGVTCPDTIGKCSGGVAACNPFTSTNCPGTETCGPDGFSDCDPTVAVNSWRRPFSYYNPSNPTQNPLCNINYPNYFGTAGTAQWIWGDTCDPAGPDVVYCRLGYTSAGAPPQAAWNPNYGWINFSTAGSRVTLPIGGAWPKPMQGAAWNKNLGWLIFDGKNAADGTVNPTAGVTIDANGNFIGEAWGVNYGLVHFNPKSVCGGKVCSDTGFACVDATGCNVGATCDTVNCTQGFGTQSYANSKRDPITQVLTGYAWSEKAGWINLGAYKQTALYIPEL